ncbi:M48 family metallopeptidase [Oceanidesulfovibrio marinus]|uniref:M48 family peptidase n=1 Tax=Oceanidesulfovibrio marinus TaxID=370038 RepID=A0A6P1ZG55_9BACT|nr:M48 family metallopeptidase [Oceanidesulfovibrio marinus]TVM33615.1 M48 family peptidase [Oceanidesulfovibrio marinus]
MTHPIEESDMPHCRIIHIYWVAFLFAALLAAQGCAVAPYTGRNQLMLVSPQQELTLGNQAAEQVLHEEKVVRSGPQVNEVQAIGRRIAMVADQQGYQWQFYVVDDPETINAFALPGGKVFVYTGLLRVAKSPDEVAAVIAHEIGHVLARHGGERLSNTLLAQVGQEAAMIALGDMSPTATKAANVAFGLGAQYGYILPFSRQQEYEADYIGLMIMAQAGYDPRAAISFWQTMMQQDKAKPPEYLSTHPSDRNRIAELERAMPRAMQYYQNSRRM